MKIIRNVDVSQIKMFVMDVDGTLTDGKIYMGNTGELFKAFDIKDGCGIHDVLPQLDIKPVIITARESDIVKNRCVDLKIDMVFQGVRDKASKLHEICEEYGFRANKDGIYPQVAYVGDDIIDLSIMKLAGLKACPQNACTLVLETADWVSDLDGGNGAVREIIDAMFSIRKMD